MSELKIILVFIAAVIIVTALVRRYRRANLQKSDSAEFLFHDVKTLFTASRQSAGISAGSYLLDASYEGQEVQLQTIIDTLAVRKLPSLWLMVTVPCAIPVTAKLDMMMRPAGVTSFSNFDFLDHTMISPPGFPEFAVLRSDKRTGYANLNIVRHYLGIFANPRFKELLIAPTGLRLVVQVAEASRAYYGVFRDAKFGDISLDHALTKNMIETLLALKAALEEHAAR